MLLEEKEAVPVVHPGGRDARNVCTLRFSIMATSCTSFLHSLEQHREKDVFMHRCNVLQTSLISKGNLKKSL